MIVLSLSFLLLIFIGSLLVERVELVKPRPLAVWPFNWQKHIKMFLLFQQILLIISGISYWSIKIFMNTISLTSDAFKQKFSNQPIKVNGFTNLSCMEIETNPERGIWIHYWSSYEIDLSKFMNLVDDSANPESKSQITSLVNEIISSIPGMFIFNSIRWYSGIDEALSFSLLTQQVDKMDYDVVVFDTAPTGHTLRLIGLPTLLEKSIDSLSNLGGSLFDMFNQVHFSCCFTSS